MTTFERQLRAAIYQIFATTGTAPSMAALSKTVGASADEIAAALRALARERYLVLQPGSESIWMAHPFSGVPTDSAVSMGERRFFANCAWDGLSILALLGDGALDTHCPASGAALRFEVVERIVRGDGLIHFLVPVRRFWDDISYT